MTLTGYYNDDVTITIEVAFASTALDSTPTWTDITTDVRSFNVSRGRNSEQDNYGPGQLNVVVDNNVGDYDPSNTGGANYPNVKPMKQIRVQARYSAVTYGLFYGFVEGFPMKVKDDADETVVIHASDGFKIFNLTKDSTAQVEELSNVRVGNLLDEANWPAGWRTLGTGAATILAYTPACETTLQLVQTVEGSEGGQFYIDGSGSAVFRNRTYRGGLSSLATFGHAGGEIPYQKIKPGGFDDKQIWNSIVVNVSGLPSQKDSSTSQDNYGIRSLIFNDILLTGTTQGDDLADVYLARYKEPMERVESITLKPEASPAVLWPQALGRELSEKITVKYITKASVTKTAVSFIESISHTVKIQPRRWETKWSLSQYE